VLVQMRTSLDVDVFFIGLQTPSAKPTAKSKKQRASIDGTDTRFQFPPAFLLANSAIQRKKIGKFHKMPQKPDIPKKTVYRLSLYLRCLQQLKRTRTETVSSAALSKAAGVKPSQLRKDLAHFGTFGTRGLGYNVDGLATQISDVLGTAKLQPVILAGVGNLGSALLRYSGFNKEGFEITAAFDAIPGPRANSSVPVLPSSEMKDFIRLHQVKMAILAVPVTVAQAVVNDMVEAGVQAILNFAPAVITVPDGVWVNNVDLAVELENLSYFIR
jgi:redox-sensing transcriptional repressor